MVPISRKATTERAGRHGVCWIPNAEFSMLVDAQAQNETLLTDQKGNQACARRRCPPGGPTIGCRAAKDARCCWVLEVACDPARTRKGGLGSRDGMAGARLVLDVNGEAQRRETMELSTRIGRQACAKPSCSSSGQSQSC